MFDMGGGCDGQRRWVDQGAVGGLDRGNTRNGAHNRGRRIHGHRGHGSNAINLVAGRKMGGAVARQVPGAVRAGNDAAMIRRGRLRRRGATRVIGCHVLLDGRAQARRDKPGLDDRHNDKNCREIFHGLKLVGGIVLWFLKRVKVRKLRPARVWWYDYSAFEREPVGLEELGMDIHRRIHIVAIDDDGVDLHVLKRNCEDIAGWDVHFSGFSLPDAAIEVLGRQRVDVIFVDYRLGATNGLEVVRRLRAMDEIRPIIFLTGIGSELVAKESIRVGADDYMAKDDLSPNHVRRCIESAINQYHFRRERALLERELREAQKMEAIGTLTAGLAHDFNNMLAGMMGETQLALRRTSDEEVSRHLNSIQRGCHRMAELIHRLLTFGQSNSNELNVVSLKLIVDHTLAILLHSLPDNIRLESDLADDPLWVKATPAGLQQVIMNLCVNAAEAMKDGGVVTLRVTRAYPDEALVVAMPDAATHTWVRLQVDDTGPGVEPSLRERIFDPFFTTKAMGSRKGTGLGLAIVWQLVRDFGGWIHVTDAARRGARFSVYLPYAEHKTAPRDGHSNIIPRGSETVLVVDDELSVLEATAGMLEHLGYSVLTSSNGADAITLLHQHRDRIGCVVLDFAMPNMNGMECSRRIQAMAPGLPIVCTSGHDLKPHLTTLAETGVKATLQKPYELRDLAQQVRGVLDGPPQTAGV